MQTRAQITAAPARERGAIAIACSAIYGAELDIFLSGYLGSLADILYFADIFARYLGPILWIFLPNPMRRVPLDASDAPRGPGPVGTPCAVRAFGISSHAHVVRSTLCVVRTWPNPPSTMQKICKILKYAWLWLCRINKKLFQEGANHTKHILMIILRSSMWAYGLRAYLVPCL